MSYHNNNNDTTTYSTPSTGEYKNIQEMQNLGEAYILPTGDEWTGDIHQMEDGTYMSGATHSVMSVPLVKVLAAPEFPKKDLVAKRSIFDQVFKKVSSWAETSEGGLSTLSSKLTSLGETINNLTDIINLALNKIENYIEHQNIQTETNGTGIILDNEIYYSLDQVTAQDYNHLISDVIYTHNNTSQNTYIFDGNVNSGLTNNGIKDINSSQIKLDMVSRTGAPLPIDEIENILTIDDSYAFGFDGTINITLSSVARISSIKIPTNGIIEAVSIDGGETYLNDWETFPITDVSQILIHISYISPVSFDSYVTNNFSEDLIGNPQIDQYLLEGIYQRTSLDIGKIKLSSVNYQEEKSFESGPYFLQDGYLKSITLSAIEVLEEETNYDDYFSYKLVIGGQDHSITPWTRVGSHPQIYYINSNLSEGARQALSEQGVGFIETNQPEIQFSLKTTLKRPESSYLTPVIKGFTFNYATSVSGGING